MDTVTAAPNRGIEASIAFFSQLILALWLFVAGVVLLSWSRARTV
jgi:hypothetical protein